jgi:hypothetical protein
VWAGSSDDSNHNAHRRGGVCADRHDARADAGRRDGTTSFNEPEQQAAAAARREAEMKAPRPSDAVDSVWMEELTWMEVRDAITAGKTTALILTEGVESNGPHLAIGKHNYVLKVMNYDYSSVQKLIQDSGTAEQIKIGASNGSDGIHEEYGIDALMALADPKTIRLEQRTKANRATINGVSLLPLDKTLAMGRKIVELRTTLTVSAIKKAMAASRSNHQH